MSLVAMAPVVLAYHGWAHAQVQPQSMLEGGNNFVFVVDHDYSFEAHCFLHERPAPPRPPVYSGMCQCHMLGGYYARWFENVLKMPMASMELLCRAKGDNTCRLGLGGFLDDRC